MTGDRVNTGAGKHIFEPFAVLKGNIGKVRIGYLEQTADQFDGVMREFFVGLRGLLYWYNVNRSGGGKFFFLNSFFLQKKVLSLHHYYRSLRCLNTKLTNITP